MKCLCCNKELNHPSDYEQQTGWHLKCIRSFFGTPKIPELDLSEIALEELANRTVNKGLTVPGVQKKLSLHLDTTDKNARLTVVDYPTGYILKPTSAEYNCLPEAEYLIMTMAREAGIKVVPFALIHLNDSFAYITKRIDRLNGHQYAMEDFCQLAERITADKYKGSYEKCGKLISRHVINTGIDMTEFFMRIVFCFLIGNSDMHYKNFSLIETLPGSRSFRLAEAYDLLPVNVIIPEDKEETALTLNGKKRNLRKKDFLALAQNIGIPEKAAVNLIRKCLSKYKIFTEMIRESYISEEMKVSLTSLMSDRCERF